jgi:protease-4
VWLASAACSTNFHIDFLGSDTLQEVVLQPNPSADKVLVIDIEGTISTLVETGILSREGDILGKVYTRLWRAAADPAVKAIILRLETPGGEVTASDIIYREILKFKERTGKPVVGLMMSVAASGGFYIAQACDAVIAHPTAITGSIGVISMFPGVEALFDKIGVRMTVIKSGGMKDSGGPFRTMTEEEKKSFQAVIDEYYEGFLAVVVKGRGNKLTEAELRPLADGRVYTAKQALQLKLIDEIGYFDSALQKALRLAGLKAARVVGLTYYPKSKTNIYASNLAAALPKIENAWERYLPNLKSGFYYLWLPEAGR